jgi:muconolactone D-isomerase
VEFLVRITVHWPADLQGDAFDETIRRERIRGAELVAEGTILRMWRIPGRWGNWGLWRAPDATALHAAIASLPSFRWTEVEVHSLAEHPNDPRDHD